ncbi:MAG TPA: hypothetical protein VMJ35_09470 [Dongiaceae bacterium]|nr:hypothetical protein [Dongiaceae bacterium]
MYLDIDTLAPWTSDWLWGLPISVVTVVIHVLGLFAIKRQFDRYLIEASRRSFTFIVLSLIAGATVCVTMLHGIEGTIWAIAFRLLNAIPTQKEAVLYSLNAMTTFGHSGFVLAGQWHLMGSLEALNGWILFGLSTAFLYAVIQQVWARATPEMLRNKKI